MNRNSKIDSEISELLKNETYREPENKWFVRKTLNRLPEKRLGLFSYQEKVCYALASILLLAYFAWEVYSILEAQTITYGDLLSLAATGLCALFIAASIAIPAIRNS